MNTIEVLKASKLALASAERSNVRTNARAIVDALKAFSELARAVSKPIQLCSEYVAGEGWVATDSDRFGFCAYSDFYPDGDHCHYSGVEIYVGIDSTLILAEGNGWKGGLGSRGDVVQREIRALRTITVREVAEKFPSFMKSFLDELSREVQRDKNRVASLRMHTELLKRVRESMRSH